MEQTHTSSAAYPFKGLPNPRDTENYALALEILTRKMDEGQSLTQISKSTNIGELVLGVVIRIYKRRVGEISNFKEKGFHKQHLVFLKDFTPDQWQHIQRNTISRSLTGMFMEEAFVESVKECEDSVATADDNM